MKQSRQHAVGDLQLRMWALVAKTSLNGTTKQPRHVWIELRRKSSGVYAHLRWEYGGSTIYLGRYPESPTGLLDVVVTSLSRLALQDLERLLMADKSMRQL